MNSNPSNPLPPGGSFDPAQPGEPALRGLEFKAVLVGFFLDILGTAVAVNFLVRLTLPHLGPSLSDASPLSPEVLTALSSSALFQGFSLALGMALTVLGGFGAAAFAGGRLPVHHGLAVGVSSALLALLEMAVVAGASGGWWKNLPLVALSLPLGALGGWLGRPRPETVQ